LINHQINNFTVRISSNVKIHDLQTKLYKSDQFLPLGPFLNNFKIHEIINFNLIGGYIESFGQPKDWIINVVINNSNNKIETGADVVKNVSGYNLTRFISGSRNKLGEINEITLRTLPFNKINKNYEPCQIENGFRAVLLPSQVYIIEKLLINNQIKYQSFNSVGIIDYVYAGKRVLDDKKLFFKKFYKLQNFIPILLNKKEDNDYNKLIMKLGENVIKN